MPNAFGETRHVVSIGAELLQDCRMRNDDAWDRGSVIRPNEYGRWASSISAIINRHTQGTNANMVMRIVTRIKEASVGAAERR